MASTWSPGPRCTGSARTGAADPAGPWSRRPGRLHSAANDLHTEYRGIFAELASTANVTRWLVTGAERSPGSACWPWLTPGPASGILTAVVAAMAEVGIDVSGEFSKPWTDEFVLAADVVITMGCGDACPLLPGKRTQTGNSTIPPARRWSRSG